MLKHGNLVTVPLFVLVLLVQTFIYSMAVYYIANRIRGGKKRLAWPLFLLSFVLGLVGFFVSVAVTTGVAVLEWSGMTGSGPQSVLFFLLWAVFFIGGGVGGYFLLKE